MGVLDNGDWLRAFYATQLGTLQNSGMPTGAAWPLYLQQMQQLLNSSQTNMGKGGEALWGENGIPGLTEQLKQYGLSLSDLMKSMVGNTSGQGNINQQLLDSINGTSNYTPYAFGQMAQGSGQAQDTFNTALSMFNSPQNQTQGDIGNWLLENLGKNPYNSNMSDIGSTMMQGGGWGSQLNGGLDAVMNQLVNNGGITPGAGQGMAMGQDFLGSAKQGLNTASQMFGQGAGMGTGMMGAGQNLMDQGNNWSNPMLQGGSQAALDIANSKGMTPFLNQSMQNDQQIFGQGGQTPEISQLQNQTFSNIQNGSYGQTQPGFDFANELMNGGGLSKYTTQGADLALQYAQGGGPSLMNGISMPNFNFGGGASFTPGADVSAGPVDSGYTQSLTDIEDKAKKILDSNPLMSMNTAVSMARNDAATSIQQQNEAMMSKALARGGGPGTTVANGLQNRSMADYADQGAQAEAKAMRDQANVQQGLQLQKYGIGADLSKAMEQVAAQRNATSSSLAGQVASANAGIHAANAGASASVANSNNSLQAALASAQSQFASQMAGYNAQRQMGGLNALGTFSGQANNQMLAGLNAIPSLQNSANQRYGLDLGAYTDMTKTQSDRQMNALALSPSLANAQSTMFGQGQTALNNLQQTQNQGQLGRINAGVNQQQTGAGLFSNSASGQGQAATNAGNIGQGLFNTGSGIASNNLQAGTGMIPNFSNAATNNFNAGTNAVNQGQTQQQNWSTLGGQLSQNNVNNGVNFGNLMNNAAQTNNQYQLGMGAIGNQGQANQQSGLSSAFNNSLNSNKFGLDSFSALNSATGQNQDRTAQQNALLASIISQAYGPQSQMSSDTMRYLTQALSSYGGINPAAGGKDGFLGDLLKQALNKPPNGGNIPQISGGPKTPSANTDDNGNPFTSRLTSPNISSPQSNPVQYWPGTNTPIPGTGSNVTSSINYGGPINGTGVGQGGWYNYNANPEMIQNDPSMQQILNMLYGGGAGNGYFDDVGGGWGSYGNQDYGTGNPYWEN